MKLNEYQKKAILTARYSPELMVMYPTLGLVGEAGEVANKVKKIYRDYGGELTDERTDEIMDELGDVLWYVANLAADLGYGLEEVAEHNIKKLKDRQERNVLHGDGDGR